MLKDKQKIDAIAWKAKKEDLSYGLFSAMLTEESEIYIYKEYEEYLAAKEAAEKARLRKYSKGKTKSNVPK